MRNASDRIVVFIAFNGVSLLDISGPLSIFASASYFLKERQAPGYNCRLATVDGGEVITDQGLLLVSAHADDFADAAVDTLMVPGALSMDSALEDRRLVSWIGRRGPVARRICSVCAGAYLLAEARLVDGRRVVTHWQHCDPLQQRYPAVNVEPDAIFVRDDPIWSSAGVTAGIDLALALVQDDHDRELAMRIARQHVVFLKRPGGQSQFSTLLEAQSADADVFADLHDWLIQHIGDADLTVEKLAERACMSLRNFSRVYTARVGRTPAKTIEIFRLEAARRLLEDTNERMDAIARRAGFGEEERMRVTFQRHLKVSPRHYRERFSSREPV
jgi:transcriptional regulator GlxA family with amidase domain